MAVFKPDQVLISPVSSYYQGKAIRQGQEANEVSIAAAKYDLETAPKKMKMAEDAAKLQEREVKLREDQMALAQEELEAKIGVEAAQELAKEGYGITYAIDTAVTNGEMTQEQALEKAAVDFAAYAEKVPEDQRQDIIAKMQDGIDINEYRQIKARFAGALDNYGLLNEDGTTQTAMQKTLADLVKRDVISQEKADEIALASFAGDESEPKQHVNFYNPDTGDTQAVRPNSPEADELAAQGYLIGSNSDKVLGLGDTDTKDPIKQGDESYILKMVGEYFGGLYDEKSMKVSFMDPAKQRRASQITALAVRYFASGEESDRSNAVKKAMIEYGEKWEEPKGFVAPVVPSVVTPEVTTAIDVPPVDAKMFRNPPIERLMNAPPADAKSFNNPPIERLKPTPNWADYMDNPDKVVGDLVERHGKTYKVTGFDDDGVPLVVPVE